jgi:hypothetical protein
MEKTIFVRMGHGNTLMVKTGTFVNFFPGHTIKTGMEIWDVSDDEAIYGYVIGAACDFQTDKKHLVVIWDGIDDNGDLIQNFDSIAFSLNKPLKDITEFDAVVDEDAAHKFFEEKKKKLDLKRKNIDVALEEIEKTKKQKISSSIIEDIEE